MLRIPEPLCKQVKKIEDLINQKKIKIKRKIAVFDLDNTLLIGDIGEAVFAGLKIKEQRGPLSIKKKKIPFTWVEYQNLLKKNKKKTAYKKMATSMSGIPLKTLTETTEELLNLKKKYIQLGNELIPIPHPNRVMQMVVSKLKSLAYEIFIISASNHFSVQIIARKFFSIPESDVFGIKPKLEYHKDIRSEQNIPLITSRLEKPISVERGKAEVYHKCINSVPPLITAGNSETDMFMLNLTDEAGLSIWVGNNKKQYEHMKKKIKYPQAFFFLKRPTI